MSSMDGSPHQRLEEPKGVTVQDLLGGSWDLVTLLIIGVTTIRPFRGVISRVLSPVISSY